MTAAPAPPPEVRRGRSVTGWAAALAGLVVLCVLGGLVLPRLIAGPPSVASPGGHPPASVAPARQTPSPGTPTPSPSAPARRPTPAAANAIPATFAGTWNGEARQAKGAVSQWAATLWLPQGRTRGTFSIPTIPCWATVTVTQVTKATIQLSERVTANPSGNCAASGVIILQRTGAGEARMSWQDVTHPGNVATATLIRN